MRRFHHFDAAEALPPGQARRRAVGDPANKVPQLLAISVIETEIVEALVAGTGVVAVLPVEVNVIQERHETHAAIAADDDGTTRFPKPIVWINQGNVE